MGLERSFVRHRRANIRVIVAFILGGLALVLLTSLRWPSGHSHGGSVQVGS